MLVVVLRAHRDFQRTAGREELPVLPVTGRRGLHMHVTGHSRDPCAAGEHLGRRRLEHQQDRYEKEEGRECQ